MKKEKLIIVMKEPIDDYPPILSLINIALEENKSIHLLAACKSDNKYTELKKQGVCFTRSQVYKGNLMQRLKLLYIFKRVALKLIRKEYDSNSLIWIVQSEMVGLLGKGVWGLDTVGHFLEVRNPNISLGYKLLSIGSNYRKSVRNLNKVICCEYNRAQITKWMFSLKETPTVLPNKPYWDDSVVVDNEYTTTLKMKYTGKKIILYQGIIDTERHLESFISAINQMPEEYVFFIMGGKSKYARELREKYESEKIVFVDFITPPLHLCVTKMCHVGVLSYTPNNEEIGNVLNVLYCAPNKLYEYSRYSKPMIANENPALKYTFSEFKSGKSIDTMDTANIIEALAEIEKNYELYSKESKRLYDSVNLKGIIDGVFDTFNS